MSLLEQIEAGPPSVGESIVIHGGSGVGKTTWAARLAGEVGDALFFPIEGGIEFLKRLKAEYDGIAIAPQAIDLRELAGQLGAFVAEGLHDRFKMIVIDSIDWVEALIKKKLSDEDFDSSWGKGVEEIDRLIRKVLGLLDRIKGLGVQVVITAHSGVYKKCLTNGTSYDKLELDMTKWARKTVAEWADNIFYAEAEANVVSKDDDGKGVAKSTGRRIIHTTGDAQFEAKNRIPGLPETLDLSDVKTIAKCLNKDDDAHAV